MKRCAGGSLWWRGALLVVLSQLAGGAASASPQEDEDLTGVAEDEREPDAWIGDHEVLFAARPKRAGAPLRSGPDEHFRTVRVSEAGEWWLAVGRRGGHVAVLVPRGYRAYVHGRYVERGELGIGRVTASRVNVRSRPSSRGDYPIGQLAAGSEVWVLGSAAEAPQWLAILAPTDLPLWVPEEDVAPVAERWDTAQVEAALRAELARRRRSFEEANADARARVEARRERERRRLEEFRLVEDLSRRLDEEIGRGAEADLEGWTRDLDAAVARCEDEEARGRLAQLRARAAALRRTVAEVRERRRRLEELQRRARELATARERAVRAAEAKEAPAPEVGSEHAWAGFLRLRRIDGGTAELVVESGRELRARVQSGDGRYRLIDFVGKPVRIRGVVAALGPGDVPLVDVRRLEIARRGHDER